MKMSKRIHVPIGKNMRSPIKIAGSGFSANWVTDNLAVVALVFAVVFLVLEIIVFSPFSGSTAFEMSDEELVGFGTKALSQDDYRDALTFFRAAADKNGANEHALRGMAKSYAALGDFDGARSTYEALAALTGSDNDELTLVGYTIGCGDMQGAKERVEKKSGVFSSAAIADVLAQMNVKKPTFTLDSGSYDDYQVLKLKEDVGNATIYYTLDGTEPTTLANRFEEYVPITAPKTVFKAMAVSTLGYESDVVELSFEIKREPKAVAKNYEVPESFFPDKSWNEDVFDYELASITSFCAVGDIYASEEPCTDVVFAKDALSLYGHPYKAADVGKANLSFLANMPYLKSLMVCYNDGFDMNLLKGMKNLESLSLVHDGIKDISVLEGLGSLRRVSMGFNVISDVKSLAKLDHLEELGLWNNEIADASSLGTLTSIASLDLSGNKIKDIAFVASMKSLSELWVTRNQIGDISTVNKLGKLRSLMQANNPGSNKGLTEETLLGLKETDYHEEAK